ncbi:MAG TPA: zinc ribbon domain-containing protein [Pyrinomonadaceae bacterium]|nr:zinc ribbon domain-containing protein [Pyrinomonadaceae bacterium]
MFCPRCGQEQISDETRFCSRCGFTMTGVVELIASGGALPQYLASNKPKGMLPRKKGLKQGAMLFFSGILLVPLLAIIVVGILEFEGYLVGIVALLTFLGGILRMIFALLFESSDPSEKTLEENVYESAQTLLNKKQEAKGLPPQQSIPTSAYVPPTAGNWRDTNDLQNPSSVTEETTRLLELEKKKND